MKKIFYQNLKGDKKILGIKSIFGQMPDWNPVEMIGKHQTNWLTRYILS